jgi:hypothetical protein
MRHKQQGSLKKKAKFSPRRRLRRSLAAKPAGGQLLPVILGTFGAAWLCWRLGGQYCAAGECHPTMAHWVWALLVPLASHRVPRSPSAPCRWQANQVLEGLKSLVAARRKEETGGWRSTLQCHYSLR